MFSGLDSSVAGEIEGAFAQAGHIIVSNSRNYRMEPTVPLLIPEVNADHLALLDAQRRGVRLEAARSSRIPNCAVVVLAMALAPLRQFGLEDGDHHDAAGDFRRRLSGRAVVGHPRQRHPVHRRRRGRKGRDRDARRSSARSDRRAIDPHPATISATTTRVPVQNGHTGSIAVGLAQRPSLDAIIEAWRSFRGRPQELDLPSAPPQPIVYLTEANRPQPALDVNRDGGMTVTVGRLRPWPPTR